MQAHPLAKHLGLGLLKSPCSEPTGCCADAGRLLWKVRHPGVERVVHLDPGWSWATTIGQSIRREIS